jgi:radical SAM protein with 4Fe4S-binding SPASM domain
MRVFKAPSARRFGLPAPLAPESIPPMKNLWPSSDRIRMLLKQVGRPLSVWSYASLKLAYRLRLRYVPSLPVTLDLEPINSCNFECPHCQVTHWDKTKAQLSLEGFRTILKQFPHLVRIKLQGMGEPLLNKSLTEMLREGEGRGISMRLTTNGSIYTEEIGRALSALDNTFITVSVDGSTPEVFEEIRVKGKLEKVRENIKKLTTARGGKKSPVVKLWTVVTQKNVHQLSDLVRLARTLGVDGITFQLFLSNWGKTDMDSYVDPIRIDRRSAALEQALEAAQQAAHAERVTLEIFEENLLSRQNRCSWPWTSSYVCANGDVVPCCVVADADTVKMGNLHEQPFSEIWNSRGYQELRERINNHDLPTYCRNCYSDPPPLRKNGSLNVLQ